ncbi:MAG TPA: serine hydrolase domain-containing protein, partial [Bacteroidota bacterium]|nr:serine hydrolase domain-containing protein [Bacteroidota bacterium]
YNLWIWFALSTGLLNVPPSSPAVSVAAPSSESIATAGKLDSLFQLFTRTGFNGNVLISRNGEVIYKHSFGYAELKSKKPLNLESAFQLASVTKQFTAMAILMLHEEGKLNVTDTIQKFFPEFPYKNITIRELLAHRAGLPEYMGFAGRYWHNRKRLMTNHDVMDMLIHDHPPRLFPPDKKYKYSNTGYAVLASVVEQVSGNPFDAFLEERVFHRLGMMHTYIGSYTQSIADEDKTKGHKRNRRPAGEDYLSGVLGDKGIYSTVEDLYKWDQALYTEELVHQSTLAEAFTPASYDRRHDSSYGYGWRIDELDDGSKIVYHAGLWRGYTSLFVRRLSDKTAIIVLSNHINWSFRNIDRLMDVLDSSKQATTLYGGE